MSNLHFILALALAGTAIAGCGDDDDGGEIDIAGGSGGAQAGSGGAQAGSGGAQAGSGGQPDGGMGQEPENDIVETALAAGNFSQLAAAVTRADLVTTLQGEGPFTVFAPTDDAFDTFEEDNPGVLASLSQEALRDVLTYHALLGRVGSDALVDGGVVVMANGAPSTFDLSDGAKINEAEITTADVAASNGVIHVIDAVMVPPQDDIVATVAAAENFSALEKALYDAGLVETLQGEGPFTVFAPTDAGFAELPMVPTGDALREVLLYHVIDGAIGAGDLSAGSAEMLSGGSVTVALDDDGVTVNDAQVTTPNILARNGVIHVIDKVLIPR